MPPMIESHEWGELCVKFRGDRLVFKDCRLSPAEAVEWDWNVWETDHKSGISPGDVADLLDKAGPVDLVILSQGVHGILNVCPATEELLRQRGIIYRTLLTPAAVDAYNEAVRKGLRVCGLFHSTC